MINIAVVREDVGEVTIMKRPHKSLSSLSLVLAALVRPGLQFSPGENEIPDDNNIVTLNK